MLKIASLLACLIGPTTAALANEQRPDIIGEALNPETGSTLYFEHYYCSDDDLACSVFYLEPDRRLIASKQIDYGKSLQAPALEFNDFRAQRELSIDRNVGDEVVVDAGFDNFVRLQWDTLAAGQPVRFPFLLMGREDPINMRASLASVEDCSPELLCLEVALDSWLLGALVDPIELTYDRQQRRLLRFRGISNLRDSDGKKQSVDIRYSYLGND